MVATNNIKTPFFSFPVNVNYPDGVNKIKNMSERKEVKAAAVDAAEKSAERISKKLNKVLLKDVCLVIIHFTIEVINIDTNLNSLDSFLCLIF